MEFALDLGPIENRGDARSTEVLARRSLLGTPQPLSQQLFLAKPNASGPGRSIMSQLYDVATRFWEELVSRVTGSLAFRSLAEFLVPTFNVEPVRIARVERHAARETRFIRRG
jgi:hypothetical protein